MLETCKDELVAIVKEAGGVMLYAEMLDLVPHYLTRYVPFALRELKQEGILLKQNRIVNGVLRFEVFEPGK